MKPAHITLLVLAAWCGGQWYGSQVATSAARAQQAQQQHQAAERARQTERALNRGLLIQSERLINLEKENHAQKTALAAVRSGAMRLSIRTTGTACGNSTAAASPGEAPRADILPADAANLIELAREADSVVRQLDAVIDAWEGIRNACTGGKR